jgi:hypothetical protein
MVEGRGVYRVLWGNLRKRDHWGDSVVNGRIILRWVFGKWNVRSSTGLSWFMIRRGDGHW